MKGIVRTLALLAIVAGIASCQGITGQGIADWETPGNGSGETTPGQPAKVTVTVSFAEPGQTRVTFGDYWDSSEKEYYLQPRFEKGDKVMLIYESGEKADLTVTQVSASAATLEGEAADGPARLVYIKGRTANDWNGGIGIDYSEQTGCAEAAVYISAPGAISNGAGSFILANAGAVLGIAEAKGLPAGAQVTGVTLDGSGLASASVSGMFGLASDSQIGSITAALSGFTVADEGAIVSSGGQAAPIFLAVPAGASITGITLTTEAHGSWSLDCSSGAIDPDSYLYVRGRLFGALPGVFSVSATEKVRFARGNLQACVNASGAPVSWTFAADQTEFIGASGANVTIGSAAGTVDLFGWSTAATEFGISSSAYTADYSGDFKDWGKAFGDSSPWRTLSEDEWNYLLKGRSVLGTAGTALGNTCSFATVSSVFGLIIYPDDYSGSPATDTIPAGCVFLPAAGSRNVSNVTDTDVRGYYWSAIAKDAKSSYYLFFSEGQGVYTDAFRDRYYGSSIRLVSSSLR